MASHSTSTSQRVARLAQWTLIALIMLIAQGAFAQNDSSKEPGTPSPVPSPAQLKDEKPVDLTEEQAKIQAWEMEQAGLGGGTTPDPLGGGQILGRPAQQPEPLNENPTAQPE